MVGESDPDLEMILADLRLEFIETGEDRLDEIDTAISRMLANKGKVEYGLLDIKRHIHSLKGTGTTYGYPSVTLWAHALEDYLETVEEIRTDQLWDIQLFADQIRDILENQQDVPGAIVADMIRKLPLRGVKRDKSRLRRGLSVLLLLPKGLQRKIVGRELTGFGFKVIIAESALNAIELGMIHRPDMVISSMVLDRMSGLELAHVFNDIEVTRHHKCLLVTASADIDLEEDELPDNVSIARKGVGFSRDLIKFLQEHNFLT